MAMAQVLVTVLGAPLGKLLLKHYLGETAGAIGGGFIDLLKAGIKGDTEQWKARRVFEETTNRIIERLLPLFEAESQRHGIGVEAVARQVAAALDGQASAELFVQKNLDSARIFQHIQAHCPLPPGQFSEAESELYIKALRDCVRYLVHVASNFPGYTELVDAEKLIRLQSIRNDVEKLLDEVQQIKAAVTLTGDGSTAQQYEVDYRLAVISEYDYLELFGADIDPAARRHHLSVAYVSLNLQAEAGKDNSELLTVEAALDRLRPESGRLLIRGHAGSGKSTLFRWTAIQAAQTSPQEYSDDTDARIALGNRIRGATMRRLLEKSEGSADAEARFQRFRRESWSNRIPFLLRLRDCKEGRLPAAEEFPKLLVGLAKTPPDNWVTQILRQGRALILLDGIDEVPEFHRETLRASIRGIVEAYPGNYYLVSTRPTAVEPGWLADAGFREAEVTPMSDRDIGQFIDRWHEAIAAELRRQNLPGADLVGLAADLKAKLAETPAVRRLATTPLLCAMICALHRACNRQLPEQQSDLCESLCRLLLHEREQHSRLKVASAAYAPLTYEQKRAILVEIAHYMVRNSLSSVETARVDERVADALKSLSACSPDDGPSIRKDLVERSGMLREASPGRIDFIHNTLKDYLAAGRFVEDGDDPLLADNALKESWQPVLLFAVATRTRNFAARLIGRLLQCADKLAPDGPVRRRSRKTPSPDRSRSLRLLALHCRAVALYRDPELETRLDQLQSELIPPRTMADAEALAAAGNIAVRFLKRRDGLTGAQGAACVRALRLIGTEESRRQLRAYLHDGRSAVVEELVQAVNPLEIPAIQQIVLRGERLSEGIAKQVTDLSPLSGLTGLQRLGLRGTGVSDLSPLSGLTGLQVLDLQGTKISDLSPLSGLIGLQELWLGGTKVSDLSPLSGLIGLQMLILNFTGVSDLSPLSELTGLQRLDLGGTGVSDLSPLSGLTGLQWLDLPGTAVSDLSPLSGLTGLQTLDLGGTGVSDVSPLSGLTALRHLYIPKTIDDAQVQDLVRRLPACEIHRG